jgi:hypothetical protein
VKQGSTVATKIVKNLESSKNSMDVNSMSQIQIEMVDREKDIKVNAP